MRDTYTYRCRKKFLEGRAKTHPLFWNALLIILYNPKRKNYNVNSLSSKMFISQSIVYDYLQCKTSLSEDIFFQFCDAFDIDIGRKNFDVYLNADMASQLLVELERGEKKFTKSHIYRTKRFAQMKDKRRVAFMDNHEEQINDELSIIEQWERHILKQFEPLSTKELSYLYSIADILPKFGDWGDVFLQLYLDLNQQGRLLFREALEVERTDESNAIDDPDVEYIEMISLRTSNDLIEDISPKKLEKRLAEVHFWHPDSAKTLCLLLKMNREDWETLIQYRKIMLSYGERCLEDSNISYRELLIILLNWLWNIPSLRMKD